jgi:hypothetical protein
MILCQPVYGGPEVMTVRGSFAGRPIDDRYTREDGCARSAYDTMERILGVPGTGAAGEDATSL